MLRNNSKNLETNSIHNATTRLIVSSMDLSNNSFKQYEVLWHNACRALGVNISLAACPLYIEEPLHFNSTYKYSKIMVNS